MSEVHAITNHWLVAVGHGMARVMTTIEVMFRNQSESIGINESDSDSNGR